MAKIISATIKVADSSYCLSLFRKVVHFDDMHKLGMNLFGGGGSGGSSSPHKEMTTSEFLKEAKEFAKTKGSSLLPTITFHHGS